MKATQTIFLAARREDPFARVPKQLLEDEKLSWKAKGIMAYLLGKPPSWHIQVGDIMKRGKEQERAVRSAIAELRNLGYAKLSMKREAGKILSWSILISDHPMFRPDCRNEDVENVHVRNEDVQNSPLSKNEGSKNEGSKNETPAVAGGAALTIHQKFINDWCERYVHRTGSKYPFTARDGKAAKQLLTFFKTPKATKLFIKACQERADKEGYPFVGTETLYDLANNIARLQAALAQPPKPQGGSRGRPEPAPKPRIQLV